DHTRAADPHLTYTGRVTLADGREIEVTTAFNLLRERAAKYPPEEAEKITGAPATTIRRIAREFALYRGVADDTWYVTWNGEPDFYAVMAILILNTIVGSLERPGGLGWMETRRFPAIGSVVTVGGKRYWRPVWAETIPEAHPGLPEELWGSAGETRIDVRKYRRTAATFDAILDAIIKDDPYPVRALIAIGSDPLMRDMDTEKVKEAYRKLELLVVVDVLLKDSGMYADYVLPDTTFLERDEIASNKWTLAPVVQKQTKAVDPPPGCEARDWIWAFMEIVRRAWPEKARALGWKEEYRDYETYKRDFDEKLKEAMVIALARSWAPVLRVPEAELRERIKRELDEKGYIVFQPKVYNPARLTALGTPSRKAEIYSLRNLADGLDPLPDLKPPAYTVPRGGDEFYLVNGKNALVSVHATLMLPMRWLHDPRVWMNPKDAKRLGIRDGDLIELEAIDTGRKARARVRVTDRVMPGVLFVFSQSFGRIIKHIEGYEHLAEGINPHTLIRAYAMPIVGGGATNCSVRVRKVS
ncbi:MAG: molybdopterin dinucleotide binding domain-containing protein, partial [Acidilobaceae archaeon]